MPTPIRRTAAKPATPKTTLTKTAAKKPAAAAKKPATKKPAAKKTDTFAKPAKKKAPVHTEGATAVKPKSTYPADPRTPPPLTGVVSLENGQVYLASKAGKFQVVNTADGMNDSTHFFSGQDVQAFQGRIVTVRGWPTDGWQTGQEGGTLAVEEWAPGKGADFVAGRVKIDGERVTIRVREDKSVEVDDATLKAALHDYDALGIVLPGAVDKQGDAWHFKGKPKDYYVLAGFSGMYGTGETRIGDGVTFNMQLAHGKSLTSTVPAASWDANTRSQRHYFFGHIEGGAFLGKGFTPSAGPWVTVGQASSPNAAFRNAVEKVAGKSVEGNGNFEL